MPPNTDVFYINPQPRETGGWVEAMLQERIRAASDFTCPLGSSGAGLA